MTENWASPFDKSTSSVLNAKSTFIYQYECKENENEKKKKGVLLGKWMVSRCCIIAIANIVGLAAIAGIGIGVGLGVSSSVPKRYGDSCVASKDCEAYSAYGLICSNGKCSCADTGYYTPVNCFGLKNFSYPCAKTEECDSKLGLSCDTVNGTKVCTCSSKQFWMGNACIDLKTFNASCSKGADCDTTAGLNCSSNGRCACSSGYFWNGTNCDLIRTYGQSCSGNSSCDATQLLSCPQQGQTAATCSCQLLYYFDALSSKCTPQKSVNTSCNQTSECRTDLGLSCNPATNTCSCSSTYYWSSTSSTCNQTTGRNGACSATVPCDTTLSLTCQSSTCQCPSTYYWDISICVLKKSIGGSCTSATQCDSTANLQCISSYCQCSSDKYWTGTSCTAKLVDQGPCTNTLQCQEYNLLSCTSGLCQCAFNYYWDPTALTCKKRSTVNDACTMTIMCETYNGLSCQSNSCKCLSTHYWDGTLCVLKKTYLDPCAGTYQCNDAALLSCSTVCVCPTNYYFDTTAKTCTPLKEYKVACTASYECYSPGQLTCQNGVCDCPLPISSKMYWVPTYKDCRILPKNCKEVKAANPSVTSGIFYLASSVGLLEAYCEMVIDGGGYTFVPWASLSASTGMLNDIYTDKSKVLFRLIGRSNSQSQPYILTKQLSQYSATPITILENSYAGFSAPNNLATGSYVFIGLLPVSVFGFAGTTGGMEANGVSVAFSNCDGTPNSYFALFANQNPTNPSGYSVGSGILDTWKAKAIAHPSGTYMPPGYFYFGEMHQGGCGGYAQTDRWSDYSGLAFGMI